jgi:hypothetical protein
MVTFSAGDENAGIIVPFQLACHDKIMPVFCTTITFNGLLSKAGLRFHFDKSFRS